MRPFDYNAGGSFFPCRSRKKGSRLRYRRFETAAEALRFAIEEVPVGLLPGSILEIDEARFDGVQIKRLYEAEEYPLRRHAS